MLSQKLLPAFVLLAISMTSTAAHAQVYVEGAVGSGQRSRSSCAGDVKCTWTSNTALKLTGGYALNKDFSLEASLFTLGNETYKLTSPFQQYVANGKTNGASLAGVFNYEFNEKFSGYTKLGIASLRYNGRWTDSTVAGEGSFVHSDTHLLLGAGLKYKLNENVSLTLGLDQYRLKSNVQKPAARTVTLGAQYRF